MDVPELPVGWAWSELGQLVEIGAQQITPSRFPDRMFNYIALEHIEQGTGRVLDVSPTPGREINSGKFVFTTQHVLYGKLRPYLRKAFAPHSEGISATDLLPLKPRCGVLDRLYLLWWLLSPQVLDYVVAKQTGVKMPRLRTGDLEKMPVPLPPVAEQRRIVAKIEALLEQSRTARQALERIPLLLQRFRQAVLSAAFRGELTERNPKDEPASALLERIGAERRQRWERGLREQGKDRRRHAFEEPAVLDSSALAGLPEGWVWVSYDALTSLVTSGSRSWRKFLGSGRAIFILTQNIRERKLELDDPVFIDPPDGAEADRTRIEQGDILITIVGRTGTSCLVGNIAEAYASQSVALTRPSSLVDGRYLEFYLSSSDWGQRFFREKEYGLGRGHLLLSHIREMPIPLAPVAEQRRIVSRIQSLFAPADVAQAAVESARAQLDKMDEAVLIRAFRGELVPQDPVDEPAWVLLERIRRERAAEDSWRAGAAGSG